MVQKEGLEVGESGEVWNGTRERVVVEIEDSKLVEASQGVGGQHAPETEPLDCEADHSALCAFHSLPLTVVEALVERVEEPVV